MTWTLRKKIFIGYGIAFLLMVIVIIWSLSNLVQLGRASEAILKENYKSILAAENMIDAIERQDSAILLLILKYTDEASIQFRENQNQFLLWLGRAQDNITITNEEQIIKTIEQNYDSYLINFNKLQRIVLSDSHDASGFYHENVLPHFVIVRDECIHLRVINQETMFEASNTANDIAKRAIWSIIAIGVASLVAGLAFSLILVNLIVKPVHQIIEATRKLADGEYDVQIKCNTTDELGIMSEDFNQMIRKLKLYHDLNIKQILKEKQKSEAIIQSIDDGLIIINDELKLENINPAAAKIFNLDVTDAKDLHPLEIIKNEKLYKEIKDVFEGKNLNKKDDLEEKIFSYGDSDNRQYYLYSIIPVKAGKKNVERMVVLLLRDITSLKELDKLKSEFIMAASHELRTPLTSIDMSISLLKERLLKDLNEKDAELLIAANDEVKRLKALVSDLLDISKIEAGKMIMDFDNVTVKFIFEKATAVLMKQAEEKSIELSFHIPDTPLHIRADANKITWVLTNLIVNAMRYTTRVGSVSIYAEKIGTKVHISVNDKGAGIPYEYQSRIFEKFVQVKNDRSPGGSGLGLAICREIVKAHGGTIWVDSEPGEGSTFTFTVPIFKKKNQKGLT